MRTLLCISLGLLIGFASVGIIIVVLKSIFVKRNWR